VPLAKICKDRDKSGKQGGAKQNMSQVFVDANNTSNPTPNTQAGNYLGGKQSATKKVCLPLRKINQRLLVAHQSTSWCFVPDLCLRSVLSVHVEPVFTCCEFESHANSTCALGQNFVPPAVTGRVFDVTPYNAKHGEAERNVYFVNKVVKHSFLLLTRDYA
jgi:hypothetical protein